MNFLIHDNGSRPFRVEVAKNSVSVYGNRQVREIECTGADAAPPVLPEGMNLIRAIYIRGKALECGPEPRIVHLENPYEVMIGYSYENCMTSGGWGNFDEETVGNTMLIRPTEALEYIWVGNSGILRFTTKSEITTFVSNVGNNNVPYAYCMTADKLILLSESYVVDLVGIDDETMQGFRDGSEEPFGMYYDGDLPCGKWGGTKLESERIQERDVSGFDFY
jgi:hypothetical protein